MGTLPSIMGLLRNCPARDQEGAFRHACDKGLEIRIAPVLQGRMMLFDVAAWALTTKTSTKTTGD